MSTSFVVTQFVALARGEVDRKRARAGRHARLAELKARVETVTPVFGYCLGCQLADMMDLVRFDNQMWWWICRHCGRIQENGYLTEWSLAPEGEIVRCCDARRN